MTVQCKDIADLPILEFLRSWHEVDQREFKAEPGWCISFEGYERYVGDAMPPGTPHKLAIAKMRTLIRRELVDGCCCGCRGDFVLTDKGWKTLAASGEAG